MEQANTCPAELGMLIRSKLHATACPGAGARGELAMIEWSDLQPDGSYEGYARLYVWDDSTQAAEVAGWFTEAGLIDVLIDQQMHDAGNQIHEGRAIDGVRSWDIRFSTKPTAQPPRPATVCMAEYQWQGQTRRLPAKQLLEALSLDCPQVPASLTVTFYDAPNPHA